MNDGPPALPAKRSSWWERNWSWVAALGCIAGVACIVGIVTLVHHLMTDSEPYQLAVAAAHANPKLVAALGTPMQEGFWVLGGIDTHSNGSGSASMTIPMKGPKGKGSVLFVAVRSGRAWEFKMLVFRKKGVVAELIDLLPEAKASGTL